MGYYTEFVKAALATFAHMGCLHESQLAGTVRDQSTDSIISGATIEAWQNGNKIRSTTTSSSGAYQLLLSPGSYTIHVLAVDHHTATFTNIAINTNQTTQLDADLQACVTVKGTDFRVSTVFALISQTVAFTATVTGGVTPISYSWNFSDSGSASGANASHAFSAQGVYPVILTADNTCQAAQNAKTYVFVGMKLIYLPSGMKNALP